MDLSGRNKVDPSFSMSSMTDLVFLLLIFFIILSTMISPPGLTVDLPNSTSAMRDVKPVSLSINADLEYAVNDKKLPFADIEDELKTLLGVQSENDPEANKGLILRIDKDVPTGKTVEVLDIAKRNEWTVSLATKME